MVFGSVLPYFNSHHGKKVECQIALGSKPCSSLKWKRKAFP